MKYVNKNATHCAPTTSCVLAVLCALANIRV
jgi:hypothetical protein